MNAMDFALRQLEIADKYKPKNMDTQIRSINHTREKIRNAIVDRPGATIRNIRDQVGLTEDAVRVHVRALVAAGTVKQTLGNNTDREAKYRPAEP